MNKLNVTGRTRINRLPERASYDINIINDILDHSFICHVAFRIGDQVNIIPTIYGRKDDKIFFHGSKNSRMLKSFESGEEICVSITLIDGIVLARSAFHHSINYRSVIIYGKPVMVETKEDKERALQIIFDHFIPGRWQEIRKPDKKELNATSVFSFKISEASAKIRKGDPNDAKEDEELNVWAGVLPIQTIFNDPVRAENLKEEIILPEYLRRFLRDVKIE